MKLKKINMIVLRCMYAYVYIEMYCHLLKNKHV